MKKMMMMVKMVIEDGDEEKDVHDEEKEEDCDDDFGGITFGVEVGIVATTNPPQAPDFRANHKLSLREAQDNEFFSPLFTTTATSAPRRMDGKWSGNNVLLGFSSEEANHGG
jgi:hypothetical protein